MLGLSYWRESLLMFFLLFGFNLFYSLLVRVRGPGGILESGALPGLDGTALFSPAESLSSSHLHRVGPARAQQLSGPAY